MRSIDLQQFERDLVGTPLEFREFLMLAATNGGIIPLDTVKEKFPNGTHERFLKLVAMLSRLHPITVSSERITLRVSKPKAAPVAKQLPVRRARAEKREDEEVVSPFSENSDGVHYLDGLRAYLTDIGRTAILTKRQEIDLARRIAAGDDAAKTELILANTRFVVSVAKRYIGFGLHIDDLIAEGNTGLLRAAGKFRLEKGVRFLSYAVWWIKQAMLLAISNQGRNVRVPINRLGVAKRIVKRAEQLDQRLLQKATLEEIADSLGMTPEKVQEHLADYFALELSLDAPIDSGDGDELDLGDFIPWDVDETAEEVLDSTYRKGKIRHYLGRLPKRERKVIQLYFGLGCEPHTLEQIGEKFNLSRERIRQIKERGINLLKNMMAEDGHHNSQLEPSQNETVPS